MCRIGQGMQRTIREVSAHEQCQACRSTAGCDTSRDTVGGDCQPKFSTYANGMIPALFDSGWVLDGKDMSSFFGTVHVRRRAGMDHNVASPTLMATEGFNSMRELGYWGAPHGYMGSAPGICSHNCHNKGGTSNALYCTTSNLQQTACGYHCKDKKGQWKTVPQPSYFGHCWACNSNCRSWNDCLDPTNMRRRMMWNEACGSRL